MAARQRDISVSEFFLKNRHLLGFDTRAKALVIAVKEAVDNALDACEEAGILPEIRVEVSEYSGECRVVVEDNGPGIVENQIARIFGKLLYGSKFHKLSQSRGQQGMGISAACMYAQLTLAKPLHILSRTEGEPLASALHVSIDTVKNQPDIHRKRRVEWKRPHGTRVEMEMEGHDQRGPHSVEVYLKQTAIANPHVTLIYQNQAGNEVRFERNVQTLPPLPREIKPHPQGVELGRLIGLRKELAADFLTATTRPAAAYRGNPFQVEVAIAYGRPDQTNIELDQSAHIHLQKAHPGSAAERLLARRDEPVHVLRFANRVPLLFQQAGCAITAAVIDTNWRNYGLNQPKGGLPVAPMAIMVHVASVWVPYTSESKEAIEPYPEMLREIKLGLQHCGRTLAHYLRHEKQLHQEYDRRTYIEKFLRAAGYSQAW